MAFSGLHVKFIGYFQKGSTFSNVQFNPRFIDMASVDSGEASSSNPTTSSKIMARQPRPRKDT